MWPQLIYLALTFIGLGILLTQFGERKTGTHGWGEIFATIVVLGLLYWGGFFDPLFK
jgi:hypothetical protein